LAFFFAVAAAQIPAGPRSQKPSQLHKPPKNQRLEWVAVVCFQSFAPVSNNGPLPIRFGEPAYRENENGGRPALRERLARRDTLYVSIF
jgi:hypothetical protein